MLNIKFFILGILIIFISLIYFLINKTSHITGYKILGESGMVTYNSKTVATDYQYENGIHQNEEGKWVNKNDIRPNEYVDPSKITVRKIANILSGFGAVLLLSPLIFLVGVIITICSLCGVFTM
mgnify:CR=1 FL=1